MSEAEFHADMLRRYDELEAQTRTLCNEAYKKGDREVVWECGATLKHLERQRADLRPPRPGVEYVPPAKGKAKR